MGTPIPSREREKAVINCIDPKKVDKRQLTQEEKAHYDSLGKPGKRIVTYNYLDATLFSQEKESVEMRGEKKQVPSKEWILEQCSKHSGKTKTVYAISAETGVSIAVVFSWFKTLEIEYDFSANKVEQPTSEENIQVSEQESCSGTPETDTKELDHGNVLKKEEDLLVPVIPLGNSKIHFVYDPNVKVQTLGSREPTQEQDSDEFILTNQQYKFGLFEVDIQYNNKAVVVFDIENCAEVVIPFVKFKAFAGNMQKVGAELEERQVL